VSFCAFLNQVSLCDSAVIGRVALTSDAKVMPFFDVLGKIDQLSLNFEAGQFLLIIVIIIHFLMQKTLVETNLECTLIRTTELGKKLLDDLW